MIGSMSWTSGTGLVVDFPPMPPSSRTDTTNPVDRYAKRIGRFEHRLDELAAIDVWDSGTGTLRLY